jgi:hypothetical protein
VPNLFYIWYTTLERKIVETFEQAIMSKSKYFGQGGKKDIDRKDI